MQVRSPEHDWAQAKESLARGMAHAQGCFVSLLRLTLQLHALLYLRQLHDYGT